MAPYYFPFVTEAPDGVSGHLIGYFDALAPRTPTSPIVVAVHRQRRDVDLPGHRGRAEPRGTARRATPTTTVRATRSC